IAPDNTSAGLTQYIDLFDLPRFQADVSNTIEFTILFLIACILLGFGSAVLLDQHVRATIFFQNIFLFPLAISFVVTGTVWRWIWNPTNGLNVLFERAGLGFIKLDWLTSTETALYALVVAAVWQMSGFCMAMFLAGLRSIPEELRSSAPPRSLRRSVAGVAGCAPDARCSTCCYCCSRSSTCCRSTWSWSRR